MKIKPRSLALALGAVALLVLGAALYRSGVLDADSITASSPNIVLRDSSIPFLPRQPTLPSIARLKPTGKVKIAKGKNDENPSSGDVW